MTEKKSKQEERFELEAALRPLKEARSAVKPTFDAKRKKAMQSRKDRSRETISAQGQAKRETDEVKKKAIQSARDKYESMKKAANDEYEKAEIPIAVERNEAIEAAAQECQRLSHNAAKACTETMEAPSEKHSKELDDIEKSYMVLMGDGKDYVGSIATEEEKAASSLNAEIASLEEKISKLQPKKKGKPEQQASA